MTYEVWVNGTFEYRGTYDECQKWPAQRKAGLPEDAVVEVREAPAAA